MKPRENRRAGPGKAAASTRGRKAPARARPKAAGARRRVAGATPARRPAVVVYFSRFGATAIVAREIARELGAELREIKAVRRQSWAAMGFGAMLNIRYPIEPMDTDLTAAGAVVLCSPIWAGKPACQVMTFLDSARLAGTRSAAVFTTWGMDVARTSEWVGRILEKHGSEPVGSRSVAVRGVGEEELRTLSRAVGRDLKKSLR